MKRLNISSYISKMSSRRPKAQGLIEYPKESHTIKKFTIETGQTEDKTYKKMILTLFETENSILLYLGGHSIYCVNAQVEKSKHGFFEEGNLIKVRYDTECAVDSKFEEGKDTVLIVKLINTFIKNTYPDVKNLAFTDISTRDCDNTAKVSLVGMKLFTDGKTWYESRFNASLYPGFELVHKTLMDRADSLKANTSWGAFFDLLVPETDLPLTKEELEEIYTTSNTFQEFFRIIRDIIGISNLCIWFSVNSWFESKFLKFVKFEPFLLKFLMTVNEINEEYRITPLTLGGWCGGSTRKLRRRRCITKSPLTQ